MELVHRLASANDIVKQGRGCGGILTAYIGNKRRYLNLIFAEVQVRFVEVVGGNVEVLAFGHVTDYGSGSICPHYTPLFVGLASNTLLCGNQLNEFLKSHLVVISVADIRLFTACPRSSLTEYHLVPDISTHAAANELHILLSQLTTVLPAPYVVE